MVTEKDNQSSKQLVPQCFYDDRDRNSFFQKARNTHHVTLSNLDPYSAYTIEIHSGFLQAGIPNSDKEIHTLNVDPTGTIPHNAFGTVVDQNGESIDEGLIFARIQNSKDTSQKLSGYIDEGKWILDLGSAYDKNGKPFNISENAYTTYEIVTKNGDSGTLRVKFGYERPIGQIKLNTGQISASDSSLMSETFAANPESNLMSLNISDITGQIDIPDVDMPNVNTNDIRETVNEVVDTSPNVDISPMQSVNETVNDVMPESAILNNPDTIDDLTDQLNLSTSLGQFTNTLALSDNLGEDTVQTINNLSENIENKDFSNITESIGDLQIKDIEDLNIVDSINEDILGQTISGDSINLDELRDATDEYFSYSGDIPNLPEVSVENLFEQILDSDITNQTDALSDIITNAIDNKSPQITSSLLQNLRFEKATGNGQEVVSILQDVLNNQQSVHNLQEMMQVDSNLTGDLYDLLFDNSSIEAQGILEMLGLDNVELFDETTSCPTNQCTSQSGRCYTHNQLGCSDPEECWICCDGSWETDMTKRKEGCDSTSPPDPGVNDSVCCCNGETLRSQEGCQNCSTVDPRWEPQACNSYVEPVPIEEDPPESDGMGTCSCTASYKGCGRQGPFRGCRNQSQSIQVQTNQSQCTDSFCRGKLSADLQAGCRADSRCESVTINSVSSSWSSSQGIGQDNLYSIRNNSPLFTAVRASVSLNESGDIEIKQAGKYSINLNGNEFSHSFREDTEIIRFFVDKNKNGQMDADEYFIDTSNYDVDVRKQNDIRTLYLEKGHNFIGLELLPSDIKTTTDLIRLLSSQGAKISSVSKYKNGQWKTHQIFGAEDFSDSTKIRQGDGIVVHLDRPITITLHGKQADYNPLTNLQDGWNLVSIPGSLYTGETMTTEDLANEYLNDYEEALIQYWNPRKKRFESISVREGQTYGNHFMIRTGQSYMIWIKP
jgi:hypothetical protein